MTISQYCINLGLAIIPEKRIPWDFAVRVAIQY